MNRNNVSSKHQLMKLQELRSNLEGRSHGGDSVKITADTTLFNSTQKDASSDMSDAMDYVIRRDEVKRSSGAKEVSPQVAFREKKSTWRQHSPPRIPLNKGSPSRAPFRIQVSKPSSPPIWDSAFLGDEPINSRSRKAEHSESNDLDIKLSKSPQANIANSQLSESFSRAISPTASSKLKSSPSKLSCPLSPSSQSPQIKFRNGGRGIPVTAVNSGNTDVVVNSASSTSLPASNVQTLQSIDLPTSPTSPSGFSKYYSRRAFESSIKTVAGQHSDINPIVLQKSKPDSSSPVSSPGTPTYRDSNKHNRKSLRQILSPINLSQSIVQSESGNSLKRIPVQYSVSIDSELGIESKLSELSGTQSLESSLGSFDDGDILPASNARSIGKEKSSPVVGEISRNSLSFLRATKKDVISSANFVVGSPTQNLDSTKDIKVFTDNEKIMLDFIQSKHRHSSTDPGDDEKSLIRSASKAFFGRARTTFFGSPQSSNAENEESKQKLTSDNSSRGHDLLFSDSSPIIHSADHTTSPELDTFGFPLVPYATNELHSRDDVQNQSEIHHKSASLPLDEVLELQSSPQETGGKKKSVSSSFSLGKLFRSPSKLVQGTPDSVSRDQLMDRSPKSTRSSFLQRIPSIFVPNSSRSFNSGDTEEFTSTDFEIRGSLAKLSGSLSIFGQPIWKKKTCRLNYNSDCIIVANFPEIDSSPGSSKKISFSVNSEVQILQKSDFALTCRFRNKGKEFSSERWGPDLLMINKDRDTIIGVDNCIELFVPESKRAFYFQCSSLNVANKWVAALKRTISNMRNFEGYGHEELGLSNQPILEDEESTKGSFWCNRNDINEIHPTSNNVTVLQDKGAESIVVSGPLSSHIAIPLETTQRQEFLEPDDADDMELTAGMADAQPVEISVISSDGHSVLKSELSFHDAFESEPLTTYSRDHDISESENPTEAYAYQSSKPIVSTVPSESLVDIMPPVLNLMRTESGNACFHGSSAQETCGEIALSPYLLGCDTPTGGFLNGARSDVLKSSVSFHPISPSPFVCSDDHDSVNILLGASTRQGIELKPRDCDDTVAGNEIAELTAPLLKPSEFKTKVSPSRTPTPNLRTNRREKIFKYGDTRHSPAGSAITSDAAHLSVTPTTKKQIDKSLRLATTINKSDFVRIMRWTQRWPQTSEYSSNVLPILPSGTAGQATIDSSNSNGVSVNTNESIPSPVLEHIPLLAVLAEPHHSKEETLVQIDDNSTTYTSNSGRGGRAFASAGNASPQRLPASKEILLQQRTLMMNKLSTSQVTQMVYAAKENPAKYNFQKDEMIKGVTRSTQARLLQLIDKKLMPTSNVNRLVEPGVEENVKIEAPLSKDGFEPKLASRMKVNTEIDADCGSSIGSASSPFHRISPGRKANRLSSGGSSSALSNYDSDSSRSTDTSSYSPGRKSSGGGKNAALRAFMTDHLTVSDCVELVIAVGLDPKSYDYDKISMVKALTRTFPMKVQSIVKTKFGFASSLPLVSREDAIDRSMAVLKEQAFASIGRDHATSSNPYLQKSGISDARQPVRPTAVGTEGHRVAISSLNLNLISSPLLASLSPTAGQLLSTPREALEQKMAHMFKGF